MEGVSHEPVGAVSSAALLDTALECPTRAEAAPGAVDCNSLFRHTMVLHQIDERGGMLVQDFR
jgi:hypothetical protein